MIRQWGGGRREWGLKWRLFVEAIYDVDDEKEEERKQEERKQECLHLTQSQTS